MIYKNMISRWRKCCVFSLNSTVNTQTELLVTSLTINTLTSRTRITTTGCGLTDCLPIFSHRDLIRVEIKTHSNHKSTFLDISAMTLSSSTGLRRKQLRNTKHCIHTTQLTAVLMFCICMITLHACFKYLFFEYRVKVDNMCGSIRNRILVLQQITYLYKRDEYHSVFFLFKNVTDSLTYYKIILLILWIKPSYLKPSGIIKNCLNRQFWK